MNRLKRIRRVRLTALRGVVAVAIAVAMAGMAAAAEGQPTLDEALQQIRTYEFGQNREMLSVVQDICNASYGEPETRKAIEQSLIGLLESDATYDCKDFVCRQLYVIGTDASVPTLAKMLTDEKYSDMARYALESIEGAAADKAFLDALSRTEDRTQIGVINSIGMRGQTEAVPELGTLLGDSDAEVAKAAAASLGRIGGTQAADLLAKSRANALDAVKPAVTSGYLMCAASFVIGGDTDAARAIYTELNNDAESREARIAAIEGLVAVDGNGALPLLLDLLKGNDAGLQAIAAGALRTLDGNEVTAAVAGVLPNLDPNGQMVALYALRARGDRAALPAVTDAVSSDDPDVKIAALEALATVGGASSVELLTGLAVSDDPEVARVAKATLASLRGLDVDGIIITAMNAADDPAKLVLIDALAARGGNSAVPELLKTAVDSDEAVRNAALEALGVLASESDLTPLLSLLVQMNGNPSQTVAENTVVAVVQRMETAQEGAGTISRALAGLRGKPAVAASLVRALGRIGDPGTLDQLRNLAINSKAGPVQDAAVRALADWPSAEVIDDLRNLASASSNDTHKALAFRGFLRLLRQGGDRPVEDTLKLYEEAVHLASSADDKRLVLAGLAEVRDERALALVEPYLTDEDVKAEAAQATEQITKNLQG